MYPDSIPASAPSSGIGEMLISSRSLAEYRSMFALTDLDLRRRILDCPAGTASLTAEVNDAGGDATACDLVYADHSPAELSARSLTETDRGNSYVRAHPAEYRWSFFSDPDAHQRCRRASGARFATDISRHPHRYIAGRLPRLPFVEGSFDLVLSSHLLFSYADRLDFSFHRDAILELTRVSRGEVRIFPLVTFGSADIYPRMDELRSQLGVLDVDTRIADVDYEFQAGGNQMLVCHHSTPRK